MFVLDLNKVHSYVDIITNSSTVIYTWSEGSVDRAKDLLRAVFDLFGEESVDIDKEFVFKVFTDEQEPSWYWLETYMKKNEIKTPFERPDVRGDEYKKYTENMKSFSDNLFSKAVLNQEIPLWYEGYIKENTAEENEEDDDYGDYSPDTTLFIFTRNDKYKNIIEKMISFLYSTDHEATQDG